MSAVWMRARAELRRRWRPLAGLALVAGLAGGAVLGAAIGARRTQTAYPRFLEGSNAHDVLVSGGALTALDSGFYEAAAALPDVEASGLAAGVQFFFPGREVPESVQTSPLLADLDGSLGTVIDRPKIVEGRLPASGATEEVLVSKTFAEAMDVRAGDSLDVRQASQHGPVGPTFSLEVVGVGLTAVEVVPVAHLDALPTMVIPHAVTRAHLDIRHRAFEGLLLELRPGADVGAFERALQALAADHPDVGSIFFASQAGRPALVQRTLRPQVVALAAFAALTAVTFLLVIGQALARQARLEATDNLALGAVGMSRSQMFSVAMIRAGLVSAGAALVAIVLAIAASPLTPIGPARLAELRPGFHANVAMLALGAAAIVIILTAVSVVPAWRAAHVRADVDGEGRARPSSMANRFSRSPTVSTGIRLALESGRGRTAVPLRATLASTTVALAAVAAVFTFGASLDRLVTTPRLYGQNWNVLIDTQFGTVFESLVRTATTDPSVDAVTGGRYGALSIGSEVVPAVGLDQLRGSAFPTLIEGRAPARPDEIVLGSSTAHRVGVAVGDHVRVGDRDLTVVGRAVFPRLGQGSFIPTSLGEGAAVTTQMLLGRDRPAARYTFLLIRTRGEPSSALSGAIRTQCDAVAEFGNPCSPTQRPAEIENYASMRATPHVLTGILALLALATLGHALVTSITRKRRELAVLKTLGFARRQVSAAVAWQASTITGLALVIGLPLGIAGGRWGWRVFAGQLGGLPETTTPLIAIVAAGAAGLALANAIAVLPARSAARTQPALVLRSA